MRPYKAVEVVDRSNTPLDEINFCDLHHYTKSESYLVIAKKYMELEEGAMHYVVGLVEKSRNYFSVKCMTDLLEDAYLQAEIAKDVINASIVWTPPSLLPILKHPVIKDS